MAVTVRAVCKFQPLLKHLGFRYQQNLIGLRKQCLYYQTCRSFSAHHSNNRLLSELRFTKDHEWITKEKPATVGITDYAQDQLGDIVFVELPEVDGEYKEGDACGVIESVKAASDVYCPIDGTIKEVNTVLESSPELVNSSPFKDGWLFKMEVADPSSLDSLMTEDQYKEFIQSE